MNVWVAGKLCDHSLTRAILGDLEVSFIIIIERYTIAVFNAPRIVVSPTETRKHGGVTTVLFCPILNVVPFPRYYSLFNSASH